MLPPQSDISNRHACPFLFVECSGGKERPYSANAEYSAPSGIAGHEQGRSGRFR